MAASSLEAAHQALYAIIAQHLKDLSLENIRIENINDVLFAIDVSAVKPLKGSGGTVYPAYPIDSTGKVHINIQLMAKIVEYQDKSPSMRQKNWELIQIEARNGGRLFSSTAVQIKDGAIILMSKVPGVPLLTLIRQRKLNKEYLKPLPRIRLAINAIVPFEKLNEIVPSEKLNERDILPRDITAGNTLIYSPTLSVTPIDLGYSHETESTKAPENEVTPQSIIYQIDLGILIPIFSGLSAKRNKAGEITNTDEINLAIRLNFIDPSTQLIAHKLSKNIIALIEKMCSHNPNERGTLEEARETLEQLARQIEEIEPLILDDAKRNEYEEQLCVLENKVFKNPIFKIATDKKASAEKHKTTERKSMFGSFCYFFQMFTPPIAASPSTAVRRAANAL